MTSHFPASPLNHKDESDEAHQARPPRPGPDNSHLPPPTSTRTLDETTWRLCTQLHREHAVDDATYAAAVEEHGEVGVADLIHALGYYVLVCMTLNTFRVDLPDGAKPPFPVDG